LLYYKISYNLLLLSTLIFNLSTTFATCESRLFTLKMKQKVGAICLFYLIAVAGRYLARQIECNSTEVDFPYMIRGWAEGVGPCLGALVAVLLLKRKFHCTIVGTSWLKSVISVAIPFVICFCFHRGLSYVLLGFIFYSFLEEVGWRGYLQGELKDMKPWTQALIIGTMWFVWHLQFVWSVNALIFWALLVFGAWGIGRIANDTKSLMACSCFHVLYNFSSHGFFKFSPLVIAIYVLVIASWFVIWYWQPKKAM